MSNINEWHIRELDNASPTPDDLILNTLKNQYPLAFSIAPGVYHIIINENGVQSIMKTGDSDQVVLTFNKPLLP